MSEAYDFQIHNGLTNVVRIYPPYASGVGTYMEILGGGGINFSCSDLSGDIGFSFLNGGGTWVAGYGFPVGDPGAYRLQLGWTNGGAFPVWVQDVTAQTGFEGSSWATFYDGANAALIMVPIALALVIFKRVFHGANHHDD